MKPIYFYSLALIFLLAISYVSALVMGKYLTKDSSDKGFKRIFIINILALICLTGYKLALFDYVLAEIVVHSSVIWFVIITIATLLACMFLFFNWWGYYKTRGEDVPVAPSRRSFLRKAAIIPAVGIGLYGGLYELEQIEYHVVKVPTKVPQLKDVVMAQVSDVHLGLFFSVEKLAKVLNNCLKGGANLLVLTGDIFDSDVLNAKAIATVNQFVPLFPYGVYFCWGNHEYRRDMDLIKRELAKTDIKVLCNDSIKLFSGQEPVYILGVDYVEGNESGAKARQTCMAGALANVPNDSYKILLAHHPNYIDDAFGASVDLTLVGHTHGGQVMLGNLAVLPLFKYMAGPVRDGNKFAYVSRGTGSWFPFRVGCPPEVIFFKFV